MIKNVNFIVKNLPQTPGVYFMKDASGKILYIGKAGDLKKRVSSYFLRPQDARIEGLLGKIKKIDFIKTDTAIEALILEAKLIKKYQPSFNVREKDDKSFLYVEFTKEKFPRPLLVRGGKKSHFGPFTSASSIRDALKILRRIFPFSAHSPEKIGKFKRPCLDYELGLCPGTCVGAVSRSDYLKNITNLKLFFEGKKGKIIKELKKEMEFSSINLKFEEAEKVKRKIFALEHIRDISLIKNYEEEPRGNQRIEGYDISNISGNSAVGSMIVFENSEPNKNEYRKFKIKTIFKSDDTGMLSEILRRRLNNNWPLPDLILVDGGKGQVNAARSVLAEAGLEIPIIGIAKGAKRKRNDFVGKIPPDFDKETLIKVRNEAHRFAISYHRKVRGKEFFG